MNRRERSYRVKILSWYLDFVQTPLDYVSNPLRIPGVKDLENTRSIQKRLKEFVSDVLDKDVGRIELPRTQSFLDKRIIHPKELPQISGEDWEKGIADEPKSVEETFNIQRGFVIDSEDAHVWNLASLLEGFPVRSFRKCKNCGHYFINLSKKEKVFCSSKCAWRYHSRMKREDLKTHPKKYQAYLKRQREIMRRKNANKIRTKNT